MKNTQQLQGADRFLAEKFGLYPDDVEAILELYHNPKGGKLRKLKPGFAQEPKTFHEAVTQDSMLAIVWQTHEAVLKEGMVILGVLENHAPMMAELRNQPEALAEIQARVAQAVEEEKARIGITNSDFDRLYAAYFTYRRATQTKSQPDNTRAQNDERSL